KKVVITKSKTSSGENRLVFLSADTINLLQDYIYEVHEKNNFDSDYLFLKLSGSSKGQVCDYETIDAFFRDLSTKLKFRSEEHTSELQSRFDLVCRLLLEKKKSDTSTETTCDAMRREVDTVDDTAQSGAGEAT